MGILDSSNSNGTLIEQGNQSFASLVESLNESWVDIPVADCYSPRMESRKSSQRNSLRSPRVSQLTRKKRSSQNSSKGRRSALLNLDDGHNEKNHDNSSTGELCKSKEGSGALDPSKPKKNRIRSKSKKGTKTPAKLPEKSLEDRLRYLPDESNAEVFDDFGKGTEGTEELKDAISVPTTPKQRKRRKSKKGDVKPVRSKSLEARASTAELFGLSPSPLSQKRKVPLDRDNREEKGWQVKARRSSLLARGLQSLEDRLRDLPDESNAEVFDDFGKGTEGTEELKDAIDVPTTPKQQQRRKSKKGDVKPVRSKSLEARASTAELFGLSPSPYSQKRKVPRDRKSGSSLHQLATMLRGAAIEDAMSVYSEGALPLDRDNREEKRCQVKARRSSLLARGLQALEDMYEDCA
jgi:hypothetical protein